MSDLYGIVKKSDLENIADAIRDKTGLSNSFKVHSMASIIESIGAGQTIQDFIDGKYSGIFYYSGSNCSINFRNQSLLTELNLPNVTTIYERQIQENNILSKVSFPNVTIISGRSAVINSCPSITKLEFPKLTLLSGPANYNSAIENMSNLNEFIAPKLSYVTKAFGNCSNLTKFSASSNCYYGAGAFVNCFKLSQIYPSYLGSSIGGGAFYNCNSIDETNVGITDLYNADGFTGCNFKSVHLSKASIVHFANNPNLTLVDIPNVTTLTTQNLASIPIINLSSPLVSQITQGFSGGQLFTYKSPLVSYYNIPVFNNMTNLYSVCFMAYSWLGNQSISNIFNGTPIMNSTIYGTYGSIYVPSSVYTYFKQTNRYTSMGLADRYVSMTREEECEYICACEYWVNNNKTSIDTDKLNAKYIGYRGFYGCSRLSEINLSKVTNICTMGIENCTNLSLISLPSVYCMCPNIAYISSTNASVLCLGVENLFASNVSGSFSKIILPNAREVRMSLSCYVNELDLPECIKFGAGDGYNGTMPSIVSSISMPKVEYIGSNTFYRSPLTELSLPSCTFIGSSAFNLCSSLTTVNIPRIKSIGQGAFHSCYSLSSFVATDLEYLGSYALAVTSMLSIIDLPNLKVASDWNFTSAVKYMNIPNITSLYSTQLDNYGRNASTIIATNVKTIGNSFYVGGSYLIDLDITNVESIGAYAFSNCYNLTSINIPNCSSIGDNTFNRCMNASIVNLDKVQTIGAYAFANCSTFSSTIMSKVTNIGDYAFQNCYNFVDLYLLGNSVPTIANNTFANTPIAGNQAMTSSTPHIYVRPDMYNAFVNDSKFNSFASIITSYIG